MEIEYWKTKYMSILDQNEALRKDNENLKQQVALLLQRNHCSLTPTTSPNPSVEVLNESFSSLCGFNITLQKSLTKVSIVKKQKEYRKHLTVMKESREEKRNMFELFCVVGNNRIIQPENPSGQTDPEILYTFPSNSEFNTKVLPNFMFPSGIKRTVLDLSESGSDYYSLLFCNYQRDHNSFIFTIKSESTRVKTVLDIANKDREFLYGCCVIVNDIGLASPTSALLPSTPKAYCLMSSFPCFELHFKVIFKLLSLEKVQRMSDASEFFAERESIGKCTMRQAYSLEGDNRREVGDEGLVLLEEYYSSSFAPGISLPIALDSVVGESYRVPKDLRYIDAEWTCPVLFSLLELDDFFKLLCAIAHEKSVVFVSSDLDSVTSCVLSYQCLLRPFKWPYLICPVLPNSLEEVLEAPFPFIAGMCTGPARSEGPSDIIWVRLDEKKANRLLLPKGQRQPEPYAEGLKDYIRAYYRRFSMNSCYDVCADSTHAVHRIVSQIWDHWVKLIEKVPPRTAAPDLSTVKRCVLEQTTRDDAPFVSGLLETQLFTNMVDELYDN